MRGETPRTAAKHDVTLAVSAREFGVQTFAAIRARLFQFFKIPYHMVQASCALYCSMILGTVSTVILG